MPFEKESEFNSWYNNEHLSEIMSIPGVLSASRYEAVKGEPRHLAYYDIEDSKVFDPQRCLKSSEKLAKWNSHHLSAKSNSTFVCSTYTKIYPASENANGTRAKMAPALQIGRIDISKDIEKGFNSWYDKIFIPGFERVPGCLSARRYQIVDGAPKYLTVYEFEHTRVSESEEWEYHRAHSPKSQHFLSQMKMAKGSPGVWEKTFEL